MLQVRALFEHRKEAANLFSSQLSLATATKEILEGRLKINYCEVSIFEPSRNVLSLGNSWRENAEAVFELFNLRETYHTGE